jgi:hypothetical protein
MDNISTRLILDYQDLHMIRLSKHEIDALLLIDQERDESRLQ